MFLDLRFDARTINLVETLVSRGKRVLVYSISNHPPCPLKKGELLIEGRMQYAPTSPQLSDRRGVLHTPTVNSPDCLSNMINIKGQGGCKNIIVDIPHSRRMFVRWLSFLSFVKSDISKYSFKTFWAADLYSLPALRYFNSKENIRIIYDSREIYSKLSTLSNSKFRQKIITSIERYFIKKVSTVVTSGELDSEYLKNYYDLKNQICEIKNFPKYKEYIKSDLIREHFNISKDKTILLYQGVLLDGRGLIPILKALQNSEKYVLVILGDGSFRAELERNIKQLQIENKVKFAGNIDYSELHNWTCSADVGLCNIEPISFSYELALPNKLFEYILAELPVLATDLPALREVINFTNCGVLIPKENTVKDILTALENIENSQDIYKENSKKVKEQFIYESQKDLILQLVDL